ncbi:MAG: GNAT family N-acetyltransferase [Alphaproteobacteria bacterium]|nr:GNAT family N-acetyltransferase [Alphaproteobacteria bacterium]MBU1563278.1 GNAT family N-acetyltransferase [Alphaproteobacteria bacterium]MBU2303321.1 GNAT family N-acetyltransferase [Alphaproteobacteria bacterium]MBU2368569.1 GNAT family N-acetyltransferase [Alphaproteobacteria bacterium]
MTQPEIRLVAAGPGQKPVIANLIQLYLYDMTETMPFPVGADGRFGYGFLERFWRFPYLIHAGDEIAGFALVIEECPLTGTKPCWFMAEFFILKAYRRRGAGQAAVAAAMREHPGDWHIAVPQANAPAGAFWDNSLAPYAPRSRDVTFEGDEWRLHAFTA